MHLMGLGRFFLFRNHISHFLSADVPGRFRVVVIKNVKGLKGCMFSV